MSWLTQAHINEIVVRLQQADEVRRRSATAAALRHGQTEDRVAALEEELDRHALLIRVLLRTLIERGVATEEQLLQLTREIDLEDGVEDGKVTRVRETPPEAEPKRLPLPVDMQQLRARHRARKRERS